MIEVKDEILGGEARYRIIDSSGNIVHADVNIEMITPVQQEGTPINKALFDSIKSGNDLVQTYSEINPIISNGYNYITLKNSITKYEKGQRVLIDTTIKPTYFNTSIIPKFSNTGTMEGFTLSNSTYVTDPQKAFDGDSETYSTIGAASGTEEISLTFPYKIKPTKIKVKAFNNSFNVYGYTDSTTSIVLASASSTGDEEIYEIVNSEFVEKIRIIANDYRMSMRVYNLEIIEGEAYMFNTKLYTYININNLGNVLIDKLLEQNKKYELVYDGTMFIATEVA
ncbi:MAG: hypothetical protein IJX99_02215 [Clostridia bacterium]|nr:hypothetical protein [Clostridia bacterium]